MSPLIIATVGKKGGIGKTTLTFHLAGLLGDMGVRVLLVDTDRSASLSNIFELRDRAPHGFTQVITRGVASEDCVSATHFRNVDLIYSDDEKDDLRGWLIGRFDALSRLRTALRNPFINDHYEVIFIDTQGAAGPVQNTCVMAADTLLCPVVPDILSAREFIESAYDLIENLDCAASAGARVPGRIVTVLYKHEEKVTDARKTAEMIRLEHLKLRGKVDLLNTVVPASVTYREAITDKIPAHLHETKRPPTKAGIEPAFFVTHKLVWELFPNYSGIYAAGGLAAGMARETVHA